MKYIQDESTNALLFYFFLFLVLGFLIVKWDIYETKIKAEKGEYREVLLKIRLRVAFIIILIGFCATVKELLDRF